MLLIIPFLDWHYLGHAAQQKSRGAPERVMTPTTPDRALAVNRDGSGYFQTGKIAAQDQIRASRPARLGRCAKDGETIPQTAVSPMLERFPLGLV